MRVCPLVCKECVLEDVEITDKWELLKLVSRLFAKEVGLGAEVIERALVEREKMGSTAMGEGVALPHARVPSLSRIYIGVIRSLRGIDFDSPDGRPVRIAFVVLAPEEETAGYLRCLSHIARMLKEHEFREAILSARSKEEIIRVVEEFDKEF